MPIAQPESYKLGNKPSFFEFFARQVRADDIQHFFDSLETGDRNRPSIPPFWIFAYGKHHVVGDVENPKCGDSAIYYGRVTVGNLDVGLHAVGMLALSRVDTYTALAVNNSSEPT
jgi:hypothetical protein